MTEQLFPTQTYKLPDSKRSLAFSSVGDALAPHVLLCLPGLLETRVSFDALLHTAQTTNGLRVVSLDFCGRGDSQALAKGETYCMSQYLQDCAHFIRDILISQGQAAPRISLLGTSMGGILAMYLSQNPLLGIKAIFLNDVGLSLNWMSIYGLYGSMKVNGRMPDAQALAKQLKVSEAVVLAVQSPTHFDLPYKKDWKGMRFVQVLNGFTGELRLVYGNESGVCLSTQVAELQTHFPKAKVLAVAGAKHPVPFDAKTIAFLLNGLGTVAAKPQEKVAEMVWETLPKAEQSPTQTRPVPIEIPLPDIAPILLTPSEVQTIAQEVRHTQSGWLSWLKRQLKPKAK